MSEVTKAHSYDQSTLCGQLRTYLESDSHPEQASLADVIKRVEEIKAKIIVASTEGEISERGSFPVEKLEEVQGYIFELRVELKKVFDIQSAIADRWAAQKIDGGVPREIALNALKVVLDEYQKRWQHLS